MRNKHLATFTQNLKMIETLGVFFLIYFVGAPVFLPQHWKLLGPERLMPLKLLGMNRVNKLCCGNAVRHCLASSSALPSPSLPSLCRPPTWPSATTTAVIAPPPPLPPPPPPPTTTTTTTASTPPAVNTPSPTTITTTTTTTTTATQRWTVTRVSRPVRPPPVTCPPPPPFTTATVTVATAASRKVAITAVCPAPTRAPMFALTACACTKVGRNSSLGYIQASGREYLYCWQQALNSFIAGSPLSIALLPAARCE